MAGPNLKPEHELIIASTAIAVVFAIFGQNVPNLADIRADKPGNVNTHKAVKHAAITSTAAVGALALLAGSPTIFIIGGATIIYETWKNHFANYGANGTDENMSSGY